MAETSYAKQKKKEKGKGKEEKEKEMEFSKIRSIQNKLSLAG